MSVYLYDNAIVDSLRSITKDNRIYITPPDNVIRTIGQISDNAKLPMISLSRTGISIQDTPHFMKFNGDLLSINEEERTSKRIQMIPIRIDYLLDIWTKNREQNDNIVRELVFFFMTHSSMEVEIPFDTANKKHVFNVFIDSQIEDNSDIVDHMNRGEYFRQTLSLYTDDAYLWKSSTRPATEIDVEFVIKDNTEEMED